MNILGPLISARLEHAERRALFEEAAVRSYTALGGAARFTLTTGLHRST